MQTTNNKECYKTRNTNNNNVTKQEIPTNVTKEGLQQQQHQQ